jgi:starch synthase (maltosyl-transferring)
VLLERPFARVLIFDVEPEIDGGRWPVKRVVGDRLVVAADLVADGHDVIVGRVLHHHEDEVPDPPRVAWFGPPDNDRHRAQVHLGRVGRHFYTLEAWIDEYATFCRDLEKRATAGQELEQEFLAGARILEAAAARAPEHDGSALRAAAAQMSDAGLGDEARLEASLSPALVELARNYPDAQHVTRYDRILEVIVDPEVALYGAWYELFPRSTGAPGRHGTFEDAARRLEYVASLGFDVVYLPPIHPIGVTARKGRNNALVAEPGDPGSPWAIGGAAGGHKATHPELGTLDDFRRLRARAEALGLRLALDVAFQTSPDHPYVREHPEWFRHRPDGTIRYAENPPKKYEDIYPFDFGGEAWLELWEELTSVFFFWIEQGVRIFRVDNPHTKSLRFWAYCLPAVKRRHPDVVFLSEAFTRPKLMYALGMLGFSQSYTYFTWRETKHELQTYFEELTQTEVAEYFRPAFWPNTPDILPVHLQTGGRGAFCARLVLASMGSATYGIYGPAFELMEHIARPGTEEYIDNEKYQLRAHHLDEPSSLAALITRINRIRREHPALHGNTSLRFHHVDNDQLLCFSKRTEDHGDVVLVVVSLDPHHTQSGTTHLDLGELGLPHDEPFHVEDLLSGIRYEWRGPRNFVRLDPQVMPAHVFHVEPLRRTEASFEHYL